ncbi:DUF3887 domain-containing protein [Membranicola marinus]|uniref:DUF3887 domain-containing protein n=1 Tax=Membranihabitans marinus TaxID=1227546 RepID=A0A953LBK0_9BACT|nr:DUF3887 domain-containing protein [Membranihabitans marinus]MBY5959848.1 DUF3887 domain-containing protein [Membranihabitans marinus]
MKNLFLSICLIIPLIAFGQKENETYKNVSDGLIRMFNAENYAGVYEMYSPVLRKFQNQEESQKYLSNVRNKYGKITECQFIKFQQNFGVYQATAEKGTLLIRISLDDQRRLVALNFSPKK